MGVNNYQMILRIELNDQICYSEHHLMVPEHFYCWVAGSFKTIFHTIQLLQQTSDFICCWQRTRRMTFLTFTFLFFPTTVKINFKSPLYVQLTDPNNIFILIQRRFKNQAGQMFPLDFWEDSLAIIYLFPRGTHKTCTRRTHALPWK